jgi:elongation factor G
MPTKRTCRASVSSTSSTAPALVEDSYKSILDRLSKKAVRAQIPMGAEGDFEGVIDLLTMKAYTFTRQHGRRGHRRREVPEQYLEEAKKYRAELHRAHRRARRRADERVPRRQRAFARGAQEAPRKAVIANEIFPVYTGSALKNKGVQLVLDAVVDYLPSPLDLPPVTGINPKTG